MAFALNPDTGPPRILRFVAAGTLPVTSTICTLDAAANVLTIDRELYDMLNDVEQHRLVRTQRPYIDFLLLRLAA